ncbi:MAG: Clp protease N-terminal domain-containing protein, partial [bacterium]|nr:Clp protease N-terminal domain-containing protein [bacterium]
MEIKCSICAGQGVVPGGLCPQCRGAGFGVWEDGKFFYWGKALSRGLIVLKKTETAARGILNFFFFLFGFFGPIFLVYSYRFSWQDLFYYNFWQTPGWPKIIFLLSVIGDCYLIYRLARESEGRGRIVVKHFKKNKKQNTAKQPSTWQEAKKLGKQNFIDVSTGMNAAAEHILKEAYGLAARLRHAEAGPMHLFAALTSSSKAQIVFSRLNVDFKGLRERLGRALSAAGQGTTPPVLAADLKNILIDGYRTALKNKQESIAPLSLLLPAVNASPILRDILFDLGIDGKKLENAAGWQLINEEMRRHYRAFRRSAMRKPKGNMNRAMTALETKVLNSFSDDLTWAAGLGYLEMCVGREQDFEKIFRILEGEKKSLVLVGERGVGKDAILEGLAWKMVEEEVPDILKDKRLVRLSVPKLVSGATPAQAAERLMECLRDVRRSGNIILAVSDIYNMAGVSAGGGDSIDLADIFASESQKGYFLTLATSNPHDYAAHIETSDLGNALTK